MHLRIFETWRLSAALLIMVWHYMRFAPPGHEPVGDFLYRLLPLMEMFFMISGFLIMMRYGDTLLTPRQGYRDFLLRRIARFYPLYLATLGFFVAVALAVEAGLVTEAWHGRYDLSALPANLLLLQAWGFTDQLTFNYVSWSMSAEWFCYLTLPVSVFVARRYGIRGLLGLAALAIVILEIGVLAGVVPFRSWLLANTWGAYRAFVDFVLGAVVALAVRDTAWRLTSHWPGWLAFGAAVTAMATEQSAYLVLTLLAAAFYLAALGERNNPEGSAWLSPLRPLGRVSLGIYLIHPVMESVFLSVIWKGFVAPLGVVDFYVFWLLPMAATLAAALLSERWLEEPAARWITARFASRVNAAPVRRAIAGTTH